MIHFRGLVSGPGVNQQQTSTFGSGQGVCPSSSHPSNLPFVHLVPHFFIDSNIINVTCIKYIESIHHPHLSQVAVNTHLKKRSRPREIFDFFVPANSGVFFEEFSKKYAIPPMTGPNSPHYFLPKKAPKILQFFQVFPILRHLADPPKEGFYPSDVFTPPVFLPLDMRILMASPTLFPNISPHFPIFSMLPQSIMSTGINTGGVGT